METWRVEDAKARFNALLDACLMDGPQVVCRHSVEIVVLVRSSNGNACSAPPDRP